jgi:glycine/D-amino acid oxidase-like deaminating enzyme
VPWSTGKADTVDHMRAGTVIVGGGLAGSAAAWALTRTGRPCVLLEAFQPGHDRGSSHGTARIFRRAYPDPLYIKLTGQARRLWTELEGEAGETLITAAGSLDFGPSTVPRDMYELLRAHDVAAEMIEPGDARDRFPGLAFHDGDSILYHPDGGVIDAERAMAAMRRLAEANGAEIRYGSPVTAITARSVHTQDRTYEADTIIVAAGAWTRPLTGHLVPLPELTVTQISAFHFVPEGRREQSVPEARGEQSLPEARGEQSLPEARGEQSLPEAATSTRAWPTFIYHGDDPVRYGLPSGADAPGAVKVSVHGMGTVTTGADRDGVPSKVVRDAARRFVMSRVPGLHPEPVKALTCLYTSTANEDFILDRYGSLVIVSACSGHGAKFAPLTGVFAANLASGASAPDPRFALGQP